MSGMLYQLGRGLPLRAGDVVDISGPHDRYGVVLEKRESGCFLIRGLGENLPPGVNITKV